MLDASAGVEMALQTPVGRGLQSRVPSDAVVWVPEHYFVEVTAVLRRVALRRQHPESRISVALDRLRDAPVRRVSLVPLLHEAWDLRNNLTIADALYVVVAKHLGAPLVTTDLRLASVPHLPVSVITP